MMERWSVGEVVHQFEEGTDSVLMRDGTSDGWM